MFLFYLASTNSPRQSVVTHYVPRMVVFSIVAGLFHQNSIRLIFQKYQQYQRILGSLPVLYRYFPLRNSIFGGTAGTL